MHRRSSLKKNIAVLSILIALSGTNTALAQPGDMKGMDMTARKGAVPNLVVHKTTAVVKATDPVKGVVTLAHGPVKTLKWPAMTMGFSVKDKALFDKLTVGKTVDVEFTRQGSDYVVTAVK